MLKVDKRVKDLDLQQLQIAELSMFATHHRLHLSKIQLIPIQTSLVQLSQLLGSQVMAQGGDSITLRFQDVRDFAEAAVDHVLQG